MLEWPEANRKHRLVTVNPSTDLWNLFTKKVASNHATISKHLDVPLSKDIRFFEVFVSKYSVHDQVLWHIDRPLYQREDSSEVQPKNPRIYNVSINLNSDYSGGELGIRGDGGDAIIANTEPGIATSFLTKNYHQIDTITSGIRYSLITWVYADAPEYYTGCDPHKWAVNV